MKKFILGLIVGLAVSLVTVASADTNFKSILKVDSVDVGEYGHVYPTQVEGKEYFSVGSSENVQVTGKEVWVNGGMRVNGWNRVTNGEKTLQQELDELRKEIQDLKSAQIQPH